MNDTPHPRAQLSAYLDNALGPSERSVVEAHLGACADCRARLAELRATAMLIRALPEPRPSRRLVPQIAAAPAWLAPLRTLSTFASGVSVFLFLATALVSSMSGSAASAPAAAPAGGAATVASGAPGAFGPIGPAADQSARNRSSAAPAVGAAAPTATSLADAAKQAGATPSPSAQTQFSAASASVQAREGAPAAAQPAQPSRSIFVSPWFWLAVAVITGALAIALQRRLRSA
ncbi:MAG: hypothetical protein E6J38_03895 [Chloroflexi bacterium]|nr:MAG: hypothetical protein E6J49_02915 [Chloroflexota bacterium]TMB96418.1 MAG: hypothetical protein E6J38_03895 [Chloroflexota bacterium]